MTISQTPDEIKAAIALQLKCELVRVALRGCKVASPDSPTESAGPFVINISYVSLADEVQMGLLRISVSFKIEGVDESDDLPVNVFEIECSFWLEYRISDVSYEPQADSIAAFKDGNAVFNCWPYARELVQSITARMAINAMPLPFLRISPKLPPNPTSDEE